MASALERSCGKMPFDQVNILIGLIASLVLAIYAFKKEELTDGGTIAAWFIGISVFAFGGWTWLGLLALFFLSSALITRYKQELKEDVYRDFAKGSTRDFWQVIANGTLPTLISVAYFLNPAPELFAAYAGVLATATADTWATELGVLSKDAWLVTSFKKVKRGVSGAVSLNGIGASIGGALFIAVSAVFLNSLNNAIDIGVLSSLFLEQFVGGKRFVVAVVVGGVAGSLADSLFGATVQGIYYCPRCKTETEKTMHKCGTKTRLMRGFKSVDNEAVNFFSTFAGGATAFLLSAVRF